MKSLSELKRTLIVGAEFDVVEHYRAEFIGERRRINYADTTGIYTTVPGKPDHKANTVNRGRGSFLGLNKAPFWSFREDGVCALYSSDKNKAAENLIIAIRLIEGSNQK